MAIVFHCACGRSLRADDSLAGKKTRCPGCAQVLRIPSPAPPEFGAEVDSEAASEESSQVDLPPPLSRESGEVDTYDVADAPRPKPNTASPPPTAWGPAPADRRPAARAATAASRPVPATPGNSPREYLYLILTLSLIPLAWSLLSKDDEDLKARIERIMKDPSPEVATRVKSVMESKSDVTLDDLIVALPGKRLDATAHLPRDSMRHWLYAALSALAFWALILGLFPAERKKAGHLLLIGVFTGTVGIILLLGCQYLAGATRGVWFRGRSVPLLVLFYLAKFIGFSYDSATDPGSSFALSFVGFTCGVGLCEELCKALPLIGYFRRDAHMGWRGACLWGLASGVGFGVSEGIMYSSNHYNGISSAGIYVVRFISCVVLHAVWSASVGIVLWKRQDSIQGDKDWTEYSLAIVRILAVPMILHGLYDTLLKKDMNALALGVGAVGFAWFTWQVESARGAPGATRASR